MEIIFLVKWMIHKDQEPEFIEYWEKKMNKFRNKGLFREILSEVKDNVPENYRTWKDLQNDEYTTFINVGIWSSLGELDKALNKFMSKKTQPFEYRFRERYALTYASDREGKFISLPEAKLIAEDGETPVP